MDCEEELIIDPPPKIQDDKSKDLSKRYKKIDGEYFIDGVSTKYQLRHLNMINVSDIHIVLVSNFNELIGIPYITMNPNFKG